MSRTLTLFPGLVGHCSGALWLPSPQTVLIADVHLGYSWAQRRRGELGPLADERTRAKLLQCCDELQPRRIVFLGDLVHAPRPCQQEREWIEETLRGLAERAALVSVRGNHDRAFHREFPHLPVEVLNAWESEGVYAIHGDKVPQIVPAKCTLVMGHVHPALPIKDASGAGRKLPVFVGTNECLIVPAFSPFAGGYDLLAGLPAGFRARCKTEEMLAFAASSTRVIRLGGLDRVVAHLLTGEEGAAKRWRF